MGVSEEQLHKKTLPARFVRISVDDLLCKMTGATHYFFNTPVAIIVRLTPSSHHAMVLKPATGCFEKAHSTKKFLTTNARPL